MLAYGWTDGSNGRSKGPAGAAAYVLAEYETREIIEERCQLYPHTEDHRFTNNDMEMTAVLLCLQAALRIAVDDLVIHCDSEWCVKIITGEYNLKDLSKKGMVESIRRLGSEFDSVDIRHVRRELNQRADWHCTRATDQKRGRIRAPQLVWSR